ncbi:GNAT family N-acetyltransferase [Glycomyces algeriensis]|uniref:GNAT family N-acetyltransferase n=1 Tax=Glycomyces algeriensis TaxID=256037 RepID=UPI0022DA7C5A|nr:GNAT family N-acetyltransferase [Glycomyces algeriensis]MDA1365436.1 GNAT family N-acetyltransferase [Glycomyces algeriensis]MDR7351121.1 GNAT superfamily N-acetyltransferase [Glycomyces algeriensis]
MEIKQIEDRWEARDSTGLVGTAHVWDRPDGKRFAWFDPVDAELIAALCARISAHRPVHTLADVHETGLQRRLAAAGFVGERYEHDWTLPVATAAGWDEAALAGFVVGPPERFGMDVVRRFDDAVRADIPGLRGWRSSAEFWADEHAAVYDPAVYPVAWDPVAGRFAGMVRVWMVESGPRLGLVCAARPYRGRGVAAALLGVAFRVLRERGHTKVVTECDSANMGSKALLEKAGGTIIGGTVELVRHP